MKPLLFLPLLLFFNTLLGQNFFSSDQFDEDELKELLIDSINQKREQKQLSKLLVDETLESAAYEQALYLMEKGTFDHKQDKSKFKTLPDRVGYFGGRYAGLGENIFSIQTSDASTRRSSRSKDVSIQEYTDIIQAVIESWEAKKESNENLSDKDFFRIGMTVVYDSVNKELGIVAVLATEPYPQRTGLKPQEMEAFKSYDRSTCDKITKEFPAVSELLGSSVDIINQQVWLRNVDKDFLEKLLVSGSDAIVADIICSDQFPCEGGNRLFPGFIQDGYLLKPVRKSNLSAKLQPNEKNGFDLHIGELPSAFHSLQCEANILLIKEGSLCVTAPYNHFGGKNISLLNIPYQYSFEGDSVLQNWTDSLHFSFPSVSAKKEVVEKLESLLTYYGNTSPEITSAKASIYYSPIRAKREQVDQWKQLLQSKLKEHSSGNLELSITEKVAWKEYREFAKNKVYSLEAGKMDSLELMEYLSKEYEREDLLRTFIDSLNKVDITVLSTSSWKTDNNDHLVEMYRYFIGSDKPRQALRVQEKLIKDRQGKLLTNFTDKQVPLIKSYSALANNQLLLQINSGNFENEKGKTKRQSFGEILFADPSNSVAQYNHLIATLQEWAGNLKVANGIDSWLKSYGTLNNNPKLQDSSLQLLLLNYHILVADHYYENGKYEERRKELDKVSKLLSKKDLSEDQANFYAEYLMFQLQLSTATHLLKPFAKAEKPTEKTLKNILSISIYGYGGLSHEDKMSFYQKLASLYPKSFCNLFNSESMGTQTLQDQEIKSIYCLTCE